MRKERERERGGVESQGKKNEKVSRGGPKKRGGWDDSRGRMLEHWYTDSSTQVFPPSDRDIAHETRRFENLLSIAELVWSLQN